MFIVERIELGKLELKVELPEGKTQASLINESLEEIQLIQNNTRCFYGEHVYINGRVTTGMALMLGHFLAHICKSVSIFDPKENTYIKCIGH